MDIFGLHWSCKNMKKKWLIILFALACAIACAFGLVGCSEKQGGGNENQGTTQAPSEDKEEHQHTYTESIIAPTCTEKGKNLYTCDCGQIKGISIDALGHDYQEHDAKSATCKEIGWKAYQTCSRCDYTTFEVIPALNAHNYVDGYCDMCQEPEPTINALTFTLKCDNTYEVKAMYKTIEEVKIPSLFNGKKVTSIGREAFYGCKLLTDIVIPDSVTNIGIDAFNGCSGLTSIAIPKSVVSIGGWAFIFCDNLSNVFYSGDLASWLEISGISHLMYYSSSKKKLYINGEELTEVVIPEGITSISDSAFQGCYTLKSVIIPNSVTLIGDRAFQSCSELISVNIPNSVTNIDWHVFAGCVSLTIIIIPNSVIAMGAHVFSGCTALTIYCEALAEPVNWENWNDSNCPVVWDYKNDID